MSKKVLIFLIIAVAIGGFFSFPFSNIAEAQTTVARPIPGGPCPPGSTEVDPKDGSGQTLCVVGTAEQVSAYAAKEEARSAAINDSWLNPFKWIKATLGIVGALLLRVAALVLTLAGVLFDKILDFTIVHLADNLSVTGGIGKGINAAWGTLRDVGNMVFIFVLLWAAIQLILGLGSDIGKTIRNIVIVGLLINFSMFFTKVVIDASNIAALGFYNSINASAGAQDIKLFDGLSIGSFSSIIMRHTGVQSFYGSDVLESIKQYGDNDGAFLVGILGAVTMLIVSVIFLVASVLFIARFILLIFLIILSPIALVGYALPALSGKFKDWWNALINQSFFAPFFMLLMWVAIQLMAAVPQYSVEFAAVAVKPLSIIETLFNFTLIIGLFIVALVLSKTMAMKTTGFSAIAGGVGTAGFGTVGFAGRHSIGRASRAAAQSSTLRNMSTSKNFVARNFAKSALWTSKKGAEGSYNVLGLQDTAVGKKMGMKNMFVGSVTGKGGFNKAVEEKAKEKQKYAKDVYGQTSFEKEKASDLKGEYERAKKKEEETIKNEKGEIKAKIEILKERGPEARTPESQAKHEEELRKLRSELDRSDESRYSTKFKDIKKEYEKYNDAGKERQIAYSKRLEGGLLGWLQGNKEAARKVREQAKGKSPKDRAFDALKDLEREEKAASGEPEEGKTEEKKEGGEEKNT